MVVIAVFGLGIIFFSCCMIYSPTGWSRGILSFSRQPYFHIVEVVSRLLLGVALIVFSDQSLFPKLFAGVGYLFVLVGIGLLLAGAKTHRAFAVRSANFTAVFRPAGVVSLGFGVFVVYSVLARPFGWA